MELACVFTAISIHEGARSLPAVNQRFSSALHLPAQPNTELFVQAARRLETAGLIETHGEEVTPTPGLRDFVSNHGIAAAKQYWEGRAAMIEDLEGLLGVPIDAQAFAKTWASVEQDIAFAFYTDGSRIVEAIAAVMKQRAPGGSGDFASLLDRIASRISDGFEGESKAAEVRQAVLDIFAKRDSPSFEWLSRVCGTYVMMCSLGLEDHTAEEFRRAIAGIELILDTDIAISLLCAGEANHIDVKNVVQAWKRSGGRVCVTEPVVAEIAHHAFIADHDYQAMKVVLQQAGRFRKESVNLASNAFARTFLVQSPDKTSDKLWRGFIREYRGTTESDTRRIKSKLQNDFGVEYVDLDEGGKKIEARAETLHKLALQRLVAQNGVRWASRLDPKMVDKARRDANVLASVEAARQSRQHDAPVPLVVSSAGVLAAVGRSMAQPDEIDLVLPLSAVATVLALLPGGRMSLRTLQGVLFDDTMSKRLTPLQRLAMRVIEADDLIEVPWAKRGSLERQLRAEIVADARRRGQPREKAFTDFTRGKDAPRRAQTLYRALSKLALAPEARALLKEKDKRIAELESRLKAMGQTDAGQTNGDLA